MVKKSDTIRRFILLFCVVAFIAIGYDAQGFDRHIYADAEKYISDIVFWDSGNARATRDYGFDPENEGNYIVAIDDNARSLRIKVEGTDFQDNDIYCQMQIGDTISEPTKINSGGTTIISTPVTTELQGSSFRIGDRKRGSLFVGHYNIENETWDSSVKEYTFSFLRRAVLNSYSAYDQNGNRLTSDPAAINPVTDEYTITIPENSDTVRIVPQLAIREAVRDEDDPNGTRYKKTISYHAPDGSLISEDEDNGATFDVANLAENSGRKYIDVSIGYSKENSDVVTSDYRLYLNQVEAQPDSPDIDYTKYKIDSVNLENDTEITCDKDTDVQLKVSVQAGEEANLTYQWLYSSFMVDADSIKHEVQNANDTILKPDTKYAQTMYYRCRAVSTAPDGRKFVKYSDVCKVTVNLTYLTPPEIEEFTKDQEVMAGTAVVFGITAYCYDWDGDSSINPEYTWYINNKADTEGAQELPLNLTTQFPGSHGSYQFDNVGIYYVYCIATATTGDKTSSTTSDFIRITVREPEGLDDFTGEGTEEAPFIIDSVNELEKINPILETGYYFKDKYFKLTKEIVLPEDWIPVGTLAAGETDDLQGVNIRPFSGIFDGDGHSVIIAENGKPLFGYVREASVKNLKIFGSRINGCGLIDHYVVDYGLDGKSDTGVPNTCDIENVTILSGSSIQKSGFIGGYASGANTVNIRNCTVQSGVIIGYDKSEGEIGSFAGDFSGTITGCESAAIIYGRDNVGGLVGRKGQSMGLFTITNSRFTGSIIATGSRVGGIAGSAYYADSAPNTPVASINNCYVAAAITGADEVGGILGSEPVVEKCWGNGTGGVQNSFFYGQINSSGSNVGGIIGYYNSLDKFQTITNNHYLDTCGASRGIGTLKKVIKASDDPDFGMEEDFDADAACAPASADAFADGTIVQKLNAGEMSLGNWKQGPNYPIFDEAAVPTDMQITNYREVYDTSETGIDTEGMQITVLYSDGSSQSVDPSEVSFSGFDKQTIGRKTITAEYGAIKTTFRITILYKNPEPSSVRLILLGDTIHPDSDKVHTLKDGGLQEWINEEVTINTNMTVKDALCIALENNGLSQKGSFYEQYDSWYVSGIQIPGTEKYLEEFTNGANSGWMYTVNGRHPDVGVDRYYLEDGDEIIFHYTDEHTNEVEQMEGEYPYQKPDNPDEPVSIKSAKVVLSAASFTYNGKVQRPSIKTVGGKALKAGTDYTATWSNSSSKNAGTYTVTITGKGAYIGVTKATYKIARAGQKMTVKATKKTLKASKLKKKARTISAITVKKQGGPLRYKKLSGSARLKINAKTGKITVRKNTKKGTYKIKVKVTSAASTNYKAASKNVTVKIVVKK